jgi:hypothetical protein
MSASPQKQRYCDAAKLREGPRLCGPIPAMSNCSKLPVYSITSSASASTRSGTLRRRALAVLRLMTSSNFVGCSTGMSAGFAPWRTLSTSSAAYDRRVPTYHEREVGDAGRHRSRLLRARRKRPRNHRPRNCTDEITSSHCLPEAQDHLRRSVQHRPSNQNFLLNEMAVNGWSAQQQSRVANVGVGSSASIWLPRETSCMSPIVR